MLSFFKVSQTTNSNDAVKVQDTTENLFIAQPVNQSVVENPFNTKFQMNEAPSAIVELMTVAMFHHSLIEFAHFPESLREQLKEANHIKNELSRLKWDATTNENRINLSETSYSTYFGFSKLESSSIYGLADTVNYGGYTKNFVKRKQTHQNETKYEKLHSSNRQRVHAFWNACDDNGKPTYVEESRKHMNKTEALFTEYTKISFICVSPNNQNENHGSTTDFKNFIDHVKKRDGDLLSKEDIVKCGCAEFVQFYETNKFDWESMTPLTGKQSTTFSNLDIDFENFFTR